MPQVFEILDSRRVPVNAKERASRRGAVPYYGATGQAGWIDDYLFDEELILLGEDGAPFLDSSKSVAYLIDGKSWVNNHAHVLRARAGALNRFFVHALNRVDYRPFVSGTTRLKLPQGPMRQITLPVPPAAEQTRIADRIDELFSDLDSGVEALRRVRRKLDRYRAAVLHAAVTGRLSARWREEHAPEPAADLLARILKARREHWEAETLRKYEAKGKTPPKGWRGRYEEPVEFDAIHASFRLPRQWQWAGLDALTWGSSYGTSVRCDYEADGEPVLRIPNIARGELDLADIKYATADLGLGDYGEFLAPGDLLVCRTNGSIRLLGKVALVAADFPSPTYFASYLIRLRAASLPVGRYLHHALSSWHGRRIIESHAASSAGQHNVSLTNLQRIPIPLPPESEMQAIDELVGESLSRIDALEAEVDRALRRSGRLRQSILKAAFEGKLVPQDPADEPASELLARLWAQAESDKAVGTGRRKKVASKQPPAKKPGTRSRRNAADPKFLFRRTE
ncbi:MAG: restriction endonuclease subunit S [Phycisphaerales bacterium]|nr:restriction endonuclease subunit S [Phycisphaerales bacterium]